MFSRNDPLNIRPSQGFSLVEVMVGMVIAMLGIIVIMQMGSIFEGQKRTTTGGDDAQTAAAIALFGLQQGIQQAGYCFAATPPTLPALGTLRPVMVNPATLNGIRDANTDTLVISYGNDACPPESASGVASTATLKVQAFAIRSGSLAQCDYLQNDCSVATNWTQIAGDIASMRAQCEPSANGIRMVLVAKNPQLETTQVTTVAPAWSGGIAINLTATSVDAGFAWQNYRYKTFEALVPIRNSLWTGALGC